MKGETNMLTKAQIKILNQLELNKWTNIMNLERISTTIIRKLIEHKMIIAVNIQFPDEMNDKILKEGVVKCKVVEYMKDDSAYYPAFVKKITDKYETDSKTNIEIRMNAIEEKMDLIINKLQSG
jgi:hypothetical protein